MLNSIHPLTITFTLGVVCGTCSALIAVWVWRKSRTPAPLPRMGNIAGGVLPSYVDADLQMQSHEFAEAAGRPATAPLVYSALRDRTLTRAWWMRDQSSEDEGAR